MKRRELTYVLVSCTDQSHEPNPVPSDPDNRDSVVVAMFMRFGRQWQQMSDVAFASWAKRFSTEPIVARLYTDTDDVASGPVLRWETRTRYRLACECGLNVEVREEKLLPILDTLADNGVSRIEIARLGAIVA